MLTLVGSTVQAKTLTEALNRVISFTDDLGSPIPLDGSDLPGVVGRIQRNAVRSADFVVTAATPGFAYRYDPETGALVRDTTSRGPVLVEPPGTIGRGNFGVGMSYVYEDFQDLNGEPLADALNEARFSAGTATRLETDTQKFSLTSHFFSFYGTWGVTDRLDVNILLPLVITHLALRGRNSGVFQGSPIVDSTYDEDMSKVGVGDILLRGKHRLFERGPLSGAAALTLRLPSGNEDNFQGLGDVVVTPLAIAAYAIGPHDVHMNLGVDANADDVERTRVRYALGASAQVLPVLAVLVDVIGSSALSDDDFTTDGTEARVDRTDIVDLAVGFKSSIRERLVLNAGVLVPLTDDGLRAEVVPVAGFELTF